MMLIKKIEAINRLNDNTKKKQQKSFKELLKKKIKGVDLPK